MTLRPAVAYGWRHALLAMAGVGVSSPVRTENNEELRMIKRVREWVNACMEESEANGTCMVPRLRKARDRLRSAKEAGIVCEVVPGAYARPNYWNGLSFQQKLLQRMQALQIQHPNWVFAGPSAAFVHGLQVSRHYLTRLCVGTSRKTHLRSNEMWQAIIVTGADVLEKDGLRITALERTLGDSLRTMAFPSGLAVADSAVCLTGREPCGLAEDMSRACGRMSGLRKARAVLALSDGRAESGGESVARAMMLELGIMAPDLQRWYDDPLIARQRYRIDFAWDVVGGSILGELDGYEKYTNAQMTGGASVTQIIQSEHRRQSHIETLPDVLRFIRFGYADVMNERVFLQLLLASGVPRVFACDDKVLAAGGVLRIR